MFSNQTFSALLGGVLGLRVERFAERERINPVDALRRLVDEGLRPYGNRDPVSVQELESLVPAARGPLCPNPYYADCQCGVCQALGAD